MHHLKQQLLTDGRITLRLRVHPGARRTRIVETLDDGTVKVDVAASPDDGAANAALLEFLAAALSVPVSCCAILSGRTSRRKCVRVVTPGRS